MKKIIAISLTTMMLLTSCGSNSTDESTTQGTENGATESSEVTESGEIEKVTMAFLALGIPSVEGEVEVENALNEILRERIGVEVDLQIMDFASYLQQIPLMLSGGEKVDVFNTIGMNFNSMYNSGYFLNLDENDLFATYGQGINEIMGEDIIADGRVDGALYGLVAQRGFSGPKLLLLQLNI